MSAQFDEDDRGEHARYQMYTKAGNDAVHRMMVKVLTQAREGNWLPYTLKRMVRVGVQSVARVHPEVHDTEPEWEIVDEVNRFCDEQGFTHISRDDL